MEQWKIEEGNMSMLMKDFLLVTHPSVILLFQYSIV